eukprot:6492724-Amphidinium_carterae.1
MLPRSFGIEQPDTHIRCSVKSIKALCQSQKEPVPAGVNLCSEQEFSISGLGLLALLTDISAISWRCKSPATISEAAKATELLSIIVHKLLGGKQFQIPLPSLSSSILCDDTSVSMSTVLADSALKRHKVASLEGHLHDVLIALWLAKKGSQGKEATEVAYALVKDIICFLHTVYELLMELPVGIAGALDLPTLSDLSVWEIILQNAISLLRFSGSNRPRRVPMVKKRAILDAVGATDSLCSATQLVAAEKMFANAKQMTPPSCPKNAVKWYSTFMFQYFLASQKMWHSGKHVSLALDAGRVSSDDLLQCCYYSVSKNIGCWGPPQVHPPQIGLTHRNLVLNSSPEKIQESLGMVVRDSRTKESTAGQLMSEEERQGWQRQVAAVLKHVPEEAPKAKKKRLDQAAWSQPRLATLDWLRAIESSMRWSTGKTFKCFALKDVLADAKVENGAVFFPQPSGQLTTDLPSLLSLTTDQQSTQLCGVFFLQNKLGMAVTHLPDPCHLCWNDCTEALNHSGFMGAVMAAICVCNVAYGPFQKSAFSNDLRNAALDISTNLTPNDGLLLKLWGGICKDAMPSQPLDSSETGRQQWLADLATCQHSTTKGPKASISRWFSVMTSIRYWDSKWHLRLLLIAWVSLRKGWAKSLADIFAPKREAVEEALALAQTAPPDDDGVEGEVVEIELAAATTSAAASSSSSAPPPVAAGQKRSRAQAKAEATKSLDATRKRSENTLHAVGRMMGDTDLLNKLRMIILVCNPWSLEYGEFSHNMRGPDENMLFYSAWAHWF